ncbi:hypothetical protein D3C78_92170 [compost metagenome]
MSGVKVRPGEKLLLVRYQNASSMLLNCFNHYCWITDRIAPIGASLLNGKPTETYANDL